MSGDGIVWATAVYRVNEPGVMLVTEDGCELGWAVPVVMTQAVPTTRGLVSTPWSAAPGSRWEQDDRDDNRPWWLRVYRHG